MWFATRHGPHRYDPGQDVVLNPAYAIEKCLSFALLNGQGSPLFRLFTETVNTGMEVENDLFTGKRLYQAIMS